MDLSNRFRQVLRTLSSVALLFSAVNLGGVGPAAAAFAYASASLQSVGGEDYASDLISSSAPAAAMTQSAPKVYVGLFKDNAVGVIDSATNQETRTIPVPDGPHGLVITPDGRKVYVSSDGGSTVSVIDTTIDQIVRSIEVGDTPHGLSISLDGHWVVVSGFGSNQAEVIDTSTDQVVSALAVASPHNSAISPDGTRAYVGSQGNPPALLAFDLPGGGQMTTIPLSAQPRALDFSPDGTQLFFTLVGSDAVQALDPRTNQMMEEIPVGASPHQPLFTPDGYEALVVAQGPGELDIVDAEDHDVEQRIAVGTFPHWIALSADGKTAYVSNEGSNDVSVVNLQAGTVTATIPAGNAPRKIAMQRTSGNGDKPQGSSSPTTATLTADDYVFTPALLEGAPGQTLRLEIENVSGTLHNFSIGGQVDRDIPPHGSATVEIALPDAGTLSFFCKYHAPLGMNGQLVAKNADVGSESAIGPRLAVSESEPTVLGKMDQALDLPLGFVVIDDEERVDDGDEEDAEYAGNSESRNRERPQSDVDGGTSGTMTDPNGHRAHENGE